MAVWAQSAGADEPLDESLGGWGPLTWDCILCADLQRCLQSGRQMEVLTAELQFNSIQTALTGKVNMSVYLMNIKAPWGFVCWHSHYKVKLYNTWKSTHNAKMCKLSTDLYRRLTFIYFFFFVGWISTVCTLSSCSLTSGASQILTDWVTFFLCIPSRFQRHIHFFCRRKQKQSNNVQHDESFRVKTWREVYLSREIPHSCCSGESRCENNFTGKWDSTREGFFFLFQILISVLSVRKLQMSIHVNISSLINGTRGPLLRGIRV